MPELLGKCWLRERNDNLKGFLQLLFDYDGLKVQKTRENQRYGMWKFFWMEKENEISWPRMDHKISEDYDFLDQHHKIEYLLTNNLFLLVIIGRK